jgi:hypothetical protein
MSYLRTIVRKAGTLIGVRRTINLIEGTNVTLTVADDVANDRVNVTITASGGGGISDGDKGDITVSSSGSVWTIDNGVAATKIANGTVTDAEFQYLGSVTSDIQTQINGKLATPTGTPDGTKYLRDDNTWQPVSGGSGLSQQQVEGII